jgi:hypothetical protein
MVFGVGNGHFRGMVGVHGLEGIVDGSLGGEGGNFFEGKGEDEGFGLLAG